MENFENNNSFFCEPSKSVQSYCPESESTLSLKEIDEQISPEISYNELEDTICCQIHSLMDNVHDEPLISIVDAQKISEGNSRRFVAYTIRIRDLEVRRRYSEFESLRTSLSRLFPTLIVPPIPEKHSMYSSISPIKSKKDIDIVNRRKRMLQVFLNRCAFHPILKKSHVFHCFLDENVYWPQILESPPISLLPESILMAPPLDPSSGINQPIYQCLPIPSSGAKLINVYNENEMKFIEIERKIKNLEEIIGNDLDKANKSVIKHFQSLADNFSELGEAYNALSTSEAGDLAEKIERFGLANDSNCHSNLELIENLDFILSDPLKELSQFHEVAKSRLKYRRQKILQYEIIVNILNQNKTILDSLEKSEIEAQKIESSLARLNNNEPGLSSLNSNECNDHDKEHAKQTKLNFFEKLTTVMKDIIDVDSTTNRKKNIEKIYEKISQLENALKVTKKDANIATEAIKIELERFQNNIRKDCCDLMINVGKCYVEWAKKNIKIWEEVKFVN